MSAGLGNKSRLTAGVGIGENAGILLTTTTEIQSLLAMVGPLKIYRFGLHVTVAKTTGTAGIVTMTSALGLTATALATVTTPDTMAAGQTLVKEFNPPLVVAAGARFYADITTAANAGSAVMFVDYVEDPLTKSYLDGLVALT